MIVEIEGDRTGCYTVTPVNQIYLAKFARHMREMSGPHADGTAFLQSEENINLFFDRYIPARKHRDAREGWPVRVRMGSWDYGHFLGFDAHEVRV